MTCSCNCKIDTPDSILNYDSRDVFEEIIPNTEYQYQQKRDELWAKYRYRGIGSCNVDYWVQCMTDVYSIIKETWDVKIRTWEQYKTSVALTVDLSESSSHYDLVTEHEDTPDTALSTTRYLSDRNTSTYDATNKSGLESKTVRDYIDAVPDPWDGFTNEFRKLFYWGI